MTVSELIEKLSQLPGELEVYSKTDYDFVNEVYVEQLEGKAKVVLE